MRYVDCVYTAYFDRTCITFLLQASLSSSSVLPYFDETELHVLKMKLFRSQISHRDCLHLLCFTENII